MENMQKNTKDKVVCRFFKVCVKKKKPRRLEKKGLESNLKTIPDAIAYLDKNDKYLEDDEFEGTKPWKVYQSFDGNYCWGIMATYQQF
jgi:hypothetical protein